MLKGKKKINKLQEPSRLTRFAKGNKKLERLLLYDWRKRQQKRRGKKEEKEDDNDDDSGNGGEGKHNKKKKIYR